MRDAFRDVRGDLSIYAEVQIEVHHALLANCPPGAIRRITTVDKSSH